MLHLLHDPTAFRAFVLEHQDRVYNLVLNRVQHPEDAEEITQDVFVAVYRNPGSFRGESSVSTWLYRIAVNKCIDYLRARRARVRGLIGRWFGDWPEEKDLADFNHPGILSENRENARFLFRALRSLPENQYTAWSLCELDGLSYHQAAEVMKVSLPAVESLIYRARKNLRRILAGMYPETK